MVFGLKKRSQPELIQETVRCFGLLSRSGVSCSRIHVASIFWMELTEALTAHSFDLLGAKGADVSHFLVYFRIFYF